MQTPKHILIAEADPVWRERMLEALATTRLPMQAAESGHEAFELASRETPGVLVTEMQLPGITGLGLTRSLREDLALRSVGIVMVTDHVSEIDRVLAFEAGVDDLLAKPFFGRELCSRVVAVMRRSEPNRGAQASPVQRTRSLVALHASSGSVLVADERVDLTPREYHLLASLLRRSGRVVTRSQLIEDVWGEGSAQTDRLVDAHIKAIRRKLGVAKKCIETVRGIGYRFADVAGNLD